DDRSSGEPRADAQGRSEALAVARRGRERHPLSLIARGQRRERRGHPDHGADLRRQAMDFQFLKFIHVLLAIVAVGFNASYGVWRRAAGASASSSRSSW